MSVAISVIVPVYNVQETLNRCLQSILKQTFTDYEVILVDDGSTDNSGKICDEYAMQYSNFRVFHKKNEGLGPTRNWGIRNAQGEYIYHCDSDDWLKEDLLEKVYGAITEADADVAVFGYDIFTENNGKISLFNTVYVENNMYMNQKEIRTFFTREYFNSFVVLSACNRMYKRSFILDNNIFFQPLRRCQDMVYSMLLFDQIKRLVTIRESYYCYIIEPGVYKGRKFNEMLEIFQYVYEVTSATFIKWSMYDSNLRMKLINNYCEQVANYASYAFVIKYPDKWKENCREFLNNQFIQKHIREYSGCSKFMRLFCWFYKRKAANPMLILCKMQQRKVIQTQ